MSKRVQCFLIERTGLSRYTLRRYSSGEGVTCPGGRYHNAHSPVIAESQDDPSKDYLCSNPPETPSKEDQRWPKKCDSCDYQFNDSDAFQVFGEPLYRRANSGEVHPLDEMPAGAMWYQDWYRHFYSPGPDGGYLIVKLPDGTPWCVDGEANNCTRKGDREHKCWIRDGAPPNVTAGKNGNTCSAGAGSIATSSYHGFLRNGYLEEC